MVCESVFFILFLISASLLLLQPEPATDLILPWFLHLTLPFPTSYDSDGLCFAFAKLGFPGSRTASVEEEKLEPDWFATTHLTMPPFSTLIVPFSWGVLIFMEIGWGKRGSEKLKIEEEGDKGQS